MRLLLTTALCAALSLPAMAQEAGREISGDLIYREKILLPEAAEILVTVKGLFDVTLGETRYETTGEQVPLPFALTIAPDLDGSLTAMIRLDGEPRWIAQDLPVIAGSEPVDTGEILLTPFTPLAFATPFDCGGTVIAFGVAQERATLRVGARDFEMQEAPAASGARYVALGDESTEFWSRGDHAMLTVEGQQFEECTRIAIAPDSYRALGNEPGWHADITETEITIVADYGAQTLVAARPEVAVAPGRYVFDMPEIAARLTIEDRLCADDMTGMPHPHQATLTLEDRSLSGCGGDPASLLTGAEWRVATVAGHEIVEGSEITLGFAVNGRAWGGTGCNRFTGGYDLTGEGLGFGQMGVTMMACSEDLMAQERTVLDALAGVRRFEIAENGVLHLIGGPDDALLLSAARD